WRGIDRGTARSSIHRRSGRVVFWGSRPGTGARGLLVRRRLYGHLDGRAGVADRVRGPRRVAGSPHPLLCNVWWSPASRPLVLRGKTRGTFSALARDFFAIRRNVLNGGWVLFCIR